ncbi:MAG: serine/threonine-protein kinase, partial [Leadbetterella sp.]|nr:serine/threonine-protein kinase [Leadbetterella sp.]
TIEVVALRGKGYFCNVHLVRYSNDANTNYAKKQLLSEHHGNPEYRHRLRREIHILKQLQECENVIDLIDSESDEDKQSLWYLMPFADFNLHSYIRRVNGTISLESRIAIFRQVISAIKFAHSKGIVHRDISPTNVLLFNTDSSPIVKVSDFGLGKTEEALSYLTHSSAAGYGQILYVSPEQMEKLKNGDEKSDIYSLGKLAYFVFTGRDPKDVKHFDFITLFRKATEDDPSARYENIDEFEKAFELMCNILVGKDQIPLEHLTLSDLSQDNQFDWAKFHEVAIRGTHHTHVYNDYIEPITTIFSRNARLQEYCRTVGSGIIDFLTTFNEMLHKCFQSSGWDFKATKGFGDVTLRFYQNIQTDEAKLICIKLLWHMGHVSDQWAVQSDFKSALKTLPNSLEAQLAEYIKTNYTQVDLSKFTSITLPPSIKLSLIEGNDKVKAEEEKRLQERNKRFEW